MKKSIAACFWLLVALLGAVAYGTIAFRRGEPLNSAFILIAALCTYAIGYRFYSKWLAARVLALDDRRATPCEAHDDGKDFVRTNKWVVFGHHFAAIAGPGPLVGPVLAAQFGYLPGTLWLLIGVVLGGAVQDFVILFCSIRRNGKSLGQMVKEELNTPAGLIALLAILAILVILLAVLALVVVRALAESSWGVFTVGSTIPIALFMGGYMRFWRVGKVLEASAIGVVLLLLAVWGGKLVYETPNWARVFGMRDITLGWAIIVYGLAASVLPVWLLLAPRDYLSTFMKLGTIFALAFGILLVLPDLKMPALTQFTDGSGLVVAGKVFPFCFITIACGAISGFHTLIASGTTPKLITRESYARSIGYGAMCLESLVAIMAVIAACALDPGVYLSMNVKGDAAATVAKVTMLGFPVTAEQMNDLAGQIGEKTLFGRTGGAATLAVGMAQIFSKVVGRHALDLWYHFAIMFEALFILTTVDAGTRVGRYILQDFLGHLWKPLGDTRRLRANLVASGLMVAGWGYFLIQGVRDPLGGINSLWPLFGIANQMLAAIALCLATTVILKMQLGGSKVVVRASRPGKPALALITFIPLVWLVAVTFTAGVEKIFHPDPRIGFLAAARKTSDGLAELTAKRNLAMTDVASGIAGANSQLEAVNRELKTKDTLVFNNLLDAAVAGAFLLLVTVIVVLSIREWILLLSRRKPAVLRESEPVWLPDYAVVESGRKFSGAAGTAALALALAKEWSGEAHLERAQQMCGGHCSVNAPISNQEIYVAATEQRYHGVRRCC
ncbi:MAG TPA: carbon starvation CstA family protein [Candidatus Acidoferrum sp.]|nr:carbon starvation CstA family protein [Candidatus Acidoferrum sp.]